MILSAVEYRIGGRKAGEQVVPYHEQVADVVHLAKQVGAEVGFEIGVAVGSVGE